MVICFVASEEGSTSAWLSELRQTQTEFPTLCASIGLPDRSAIEIDAWRSRDYAMWQFDRQLDQFETAPLRLAIACRDEEADLASIHVLNRAQRVISRRNRHSRSALFERLQQAHRSLHALEMPLVRSDYDHARDTWQWVLRLAPEASFEVQAAALFHDIERLESEAQARIEQHAPDYQKFKNAHARRGAAIAAGALAHVGATHQQIDRVAELIASHEAPSGDAELCLLNDADALSFFSFNSSGYFDYYGLEQGEKKVAYTLARLSPAARKRLALVHLRVDVAEALARVHEAATPPTLVSSS